MRKLLVVLVGASLLAPAPAQAKLPPTRDILTVGNNWDGTADLVDPRRFKVLKRLNIVPDQDQRMAEIQSDPVRARLLPRHPPARRRGPRPARRRRVHLARRPPALRLAAELRRRRRDPAEDRRDRLAHEGRGQPRRPHGDLARRHAAARLGLDRAQGARARHPHGQDRRQLRVRRPAAREQLLRRRLADLPRQHRHASSRPPTTRCSTPRRATAGSRSSTRRRCRSCERLDMGAKLAEAGYPGMSSAVRPMARRARTSGSSTSRSRSSTASSSTTSSRTA